MKLNQAQDRSQMMQALTSWILTLYQGRMKVIEQVRTTEWAMIGSLGDDSLLGVIPAYRRVQASPDSAQMVSAFNLRIQDARLKTQNYDKGCDQLRWSLD
jgi:hypothetical protein